MIVEIIAISVVFAIVGAVFLAAVDALIRMKERKMTHRCIKTAEWRLDEKEIYCDTYSCTEHLSEMVSDDTISITPYHEEGQCCYLGPKCSISKSAPFEMPEEWKDLDDSQDP